MSIYLGVDVGTQSVKVVLFDGDERRVVAQSASPLGMISRCDGSREQLAAWWTTALRQCLVSIDGRDLRSVAAVGVSGQQHGFVALSRDGEVLAPVKLWCDTSTSPQCEQITAAFGGRERCITELGNPILPAYTASKILWLKQAHPDLYKRLDTILLPHDYVNFYLTGERSMECGDASGTGLLDIRSRHWHRGILAAVDDRRDLDDLLPPLKASDAFVGELRPEVAGDLGLRAGIPVAAGGGDNMLAAIGTGNVAEGRLTVSLGTSGTLFAYAQHPVVDSSSMLGAFCDSTGGWLPLYCSMNCTLATELTRQVLNLPRQHVDELLAGVAPGAEGVLTLPYFQGERVPDVASGQGCILGLGPDNYTRENLMRSAMESTVYSLRQGLEVLRGQGLQGDSVRLTGGGAASAVWRQIVADVLQLPVTVQRVDEGAALGGALQALWVLEGKSSTRTLPDLLDHCLQLDESRSCEPRSWAVSSYSEHFQRYLQHVAAFSEWQVS